MSIAPLFPAGIVPSIMIGLSLMVLTAIIASASNYLKGEMVPLRETMRISAGALLGSLTVVIIVNGVIIVGGVIFGIFTATESAAIAVIYAFLVAMFAYRELTWRHLPKLMAGVVRAVAMVMILIGFAPVFAYMMALMRIPATVTDFF